MNKALIIFVSIHHNNTKKLVEEISLKMPVDLMDLTKYDNADLCMCNYDVVCFASGIYHGSIHKSIFKFIDENRNNIPENIFLIITSGTVNKKYPINISKTFKVKGLVVKDLFHCRGYDNFGILKYIGGISKNHPNKNDIINGVEFIRKILSV